MSDVFRAIIFDYQLHPEIQKNIVETFNIDPEERYAIGSDEENRIFILHGLKLKKMREIDNKKDLEISFISNKPEFSKDFNEEVYQMSINMNEYVQRLGKDTPNDE